MRRLIIFLLNRLKEGRPWVQARLPGVRETVRTYVGYLAITALLLVLSFSLLTYHAYRDYRGGTWSVSGAKGPQEQKNPAGEEEELTKPVTAAQEKESQQALTPNNQRPEINKPASPGTAAETMEIGREEMQKPLSGTIVAAYGWQEDTIYKDWRFFPGIDILAAGGSEVYAVKSGQIIDVSEKEKNFSVKIAHADGMVTLYGYLGESYLSTGQFIKQGQALGRLGTAEETALHFEIWQDNHSIDPGELFGG